jgi:acetyl-CoA decarbonylase/synthase complex subunit gamma
MALTGLQIYKLLPQTNCKECGYPTCLAFAMKLAAKQAELAACPYVTDEAKTQLEAASAPPIRLVTVASDGAKVEAGNETVLFRHEKTFYHKPGLFIHVQDVEDVESIKARVAEADAYLVDYVGIRLGVDGFAVEALSEDGVKFAEAVGATRSVSNKPARR